ncbi:hypothetical protein DIPPA_22618 [Diplonema papillatum]|nr:hypothetical protein DIPPA_22618 [Diplonema papillatum]
MRARFTTVGSKATYDSNSVGYVSWCGSMGVEPYPTTVERSEEFGGHLLLMGDDGAAYRAPQNITASVLAENKAAGCVLDDLLNIVGRMMAVLGKESPDPQQAEPLGVKEFRAIFDAIRTTGGYGAALHALQILGDFFTLLRTSSMRAIRAEDVTLNGGRLRVEWRMAKGKRECMRFLTFEAIHLVPPLTLRAGSRCLLLAFASRDSGIFPPPVKLSKPGRLTLICCGGVGREGRVGRRELHTNPEEDRPTRA